MIDPKDNENQQWLDALAGHPRPQGVPTGDVQALALRKALQERSRTIDKEVPEADSELYEQIRFRLRRERLTDTHRWSRTRVAWALTATLVLGVGFVLQSMWLSQQPRDSLALRGGGTVLIVSDPEGRLIELQRDLKVMGIESMVERLEKGKIKVTLTASPEVMDYLGSLRIEPPVTDGRVILVLAPE